MLVFALGLGIMAHYWALLQMIMVYFTLIFLVLFLWGGLLAMMNMIEGRRIDEPKLAVLALGPLFLLLIALSIVLWTQKQSLLNILISLSLSLLVSGVVPTAIADFQQDFNLGRSDWGLGTLFLGPQLLLQLSFCCCPQQRPRPADIKF
jgi:peptidoglycan/LPS O-acetylase OafA/YrhL